MKDSDYTSTFSFKSIQMNVMNQIWLRCLKHHPSYFLSTDTQPESHRSLPMFPNQIGKVLFQSWLGKCKQESTDMSHQPSFMTLGPLQSCGRKSHRPSALKTFPNGSAVCTFAMFLISQIQDQQLPLSQSILNEKFIMKCLHLSIKKTLRKHSAPDNAQLWVYYAQIWILTHRLQICASSWCTRISKAIKIVDGHLAHQQHQISKVWNAKLCLSNHIPVRDADWFKCPAVVFPSWLVRNSHSFYATISILCLCHFNWKHVTYTWLTQVKKCSAAKSDENIIVEGE